MALTEVDQTVPIPTSVVQKTRSDGTRIMPVYLADNVGGGAKKQYISSATTTTVLTGGGWLKQFVAVGGSTGTVTAYDAVTATGNAIFAKSMASGDNSTFQPIRCDTGITVVTASALDVWVHWDADAA